MNQQQPTAVIPFSDIVRPLTNFSAICYANATFQTLLSIEEIRECISSLPIDNYLRSFVAKYFDGSTTRLNPSEYYRKMEIILPQGEQDDIISFLDRFTNKNTELGSLYGQLNRDIGGQGTVITYSSCIGIERQNDIQPGIDEVITPIPDTLKILNVAIDRHIIENSGVSVFVKEPIKINMYLNVNSQCYKLRGIIIHTGTERNGHFHAILNRKSDVIYASDTHVSKVLPDFITTDFINKNAALCIYSKSEDAISGRLFEVAHRETFEAEISTNDALQSENQSISNTITRGGLIRSTQPKNKKNGERDGMLYIKTDNENELKIIPQKPNEEFLDETWLPFVHKRDNKVNLHDEYLYLHGFLNTQVKNSPEKDIIGAKPLYQDRLNLLERFVRVLGKIKFNYKESIGNLNAEGTADVLQLQAIIPQQSEAVEAANILNRYMNSLGSEPPNDDIIQNKIEELLFELIDKGKLEEDCYSSDPKSISLTEEDVYYVLGPTYNWKARCDELCIDEVLKRITLSDDEEEVKETTDMQKRNALREKLWYEYTTNFGNYSGMTSFLKSFVESRNASICKGEIGIQYSQAAKLINKFIANNGVIYVKKKGGAKPKVTEDVLKCLIATVFDFPDALDKERLEYLNKYGPCINDNICEKTVNNALHNLNITIKDPSFSPAARNCFGYRIARILWATVMKEISNAPGSLICFIDEAGVMLNKRKRARGFLSMIPITNKPTYGKNISNLACIIPNFGVMYRWYSRAVKSDDYQTFLRDIPYIIRNKLGNEEMQLIVVNDNATIHKTDGVRDTAKLCKINLAYTVPYSPQTNFPAENYFCQMKHVVCYSFKTVANEPINEAQNPIQHENYSYKDFVLKQWDEHTRKFYDCTSTAKVYGVWLNVLDKCIDGEALNGQRLEPKKDFTFSNVNVNLTGKRKNI